MKIRVLLVAFVFAALQVMAAPTLTRVMPADGSTNVGISGSIVLMFNTQIQAGDAECTLNGEKITPTIVSTVAKFEYAGLSYSTDYTLVVPAGAILDKSGESFAGTTYRFRTQDKPEVAPKLFDFVVDPDAQQVTSSLGKTIQSAFDAIPNKSSKRFYVFIKNGVYNERLTLSKDKQNVSFIGESRDGVVIQHFGNPAVEIYGKHIYFENLTFKATNNPDVTQYNIAIYAEGEQNIYKNVRFLGHQDTQRTGGDRHYMKNCEIHGTIDFIYGSGNVFYDECDIYLEKRNKMMLESTTWDTACVIAAGAHGADEIWGHVFSHCTIDGDPSNDNRYSLGRPWHNLCRAVYLHTTMNIKPFAFGWTSMGNPPALYAEYGSVDAQGNPIDLSKRHNKYIYNDSVYTCDFNPVLTAEEAARYTLRNVLAGDDAWHPDVISAAAPAPMLIAQNSGQIRWQAVPYSICYVIRKDGLYLDAVIDTTYQLPEEGFYSVEAIGEYGFASERLSVQYHAATAIESVTLPCQYSVKADAVCFEATDKPYHLSVYDVNGVCYFSQNMSGQAYRLPLASGSMYILKISNEQSTWQRKLMIH